MGVKHIAAGMAAVAAAGSPAHADIMHWYWEVEVNGAGVDATQPVHVRAGDHVDIELWAEWTPRAHGFANAIPSISTGDVFFALAQFVNIDEQQGYGRNPTLSDFTINSGDILDSDNSGIPDIIDFISLAQLPENMNANYDDSNPILGYRIGWALAATPGSGITLLRVPPLDYPTEFPDTVYTDPFGGMVEYATVADPLVFIPSPSGLVLFALVLFRPRRHRCVR